MASYGPSREILVLITYAQKPPINALAKLSGGGGGGGGGG